MWQTITKHLKKFDSGVLTVVEESGYPFSIRCEITPDDDNQILLLSLPTDKFINSGPASLSLHKHNEKLWDLKTLGILGQLEKREDEWIFHPEKTLLGLGMSQWGMESIQTLIRMRKNSNRYLEKHNLPRPKVAWDEIKTLHKEARQLNKNK